MLMRPDPFWTKDFHQPGMHNFDSIIVEGLVVEKLVEQKLDLSRGSVLNSEFCSVLVDLTLDVVAQKLLSLTDIRAETLHFHNKLQVCPSQLRVHVQLKQYGIEDNGASPLFDPFRY